MIKDMNKYLVDMILINYFRLGSCKKSLILSHFRVDTTKRLEALRSKLRSLRLDAFLVPSGDSHQSEYVALADKRRQWIGGFSGSSGFAVVTLDKAAMWTDGRYTACYTHIVGRVGRASSGNLFSI
jgi:hypothetical protein